MPFLRDNNYITTMGKPGHQRLGRRRKNDSTTVTTHRMWRRIRSYAGYPG